MNKRTLFNAKTKVGIQVGEQTLKIIQLYKEKGEWLEKQSVVEPLSQGIVKEGEVLQPDLLGLKIKEVLANYQIRAKKVSIFLEEMPFFVRRIQIPKIPKREVKDTLFYKTQLEIPTDIHQLIVRYSFFKSKTEDNKQIDEYMIFAVYRSYIKKLIKAIQNAGLYVEHFGVEPDAIYNGLLYKNVIENKSDQQLLIRTDSKRTMLAIYSEGSLVYARYLPIAISDHSTELEMEIERTIVSWNGKNRNQKVKEVIILGQNEHWSDIKKRLENFMSSVTVQLVTSPFTACKGIALKDFTNDQYHYIENGTFRTKPRAITNKLILPVSILLFLGFSYLVGYPYVLERGNHVLEKQIEELSEISQLMEQEKDLAHLKMNLMQMKDKLTNEHIEVLSLLESITSQQPESIRITQLTFSQLEISLNGEAQSQADVLTFYKGLQRNTNLGDVQLVQSSQTEKHTLFNIKVVGE